MKLRAVRLANEVVNDRLEPEVKRLNELAASIGVMCRGIFFGSNREEVGYLRIFYRLKDDLENDARRLKEGDGV